MAKQDYGSWVNESRSSHSLFLSLWSAYPPGFQINAAPYATCLSKFLWSLTFHNSLTSKSVIAAYSCYQYLPNFFLFAHKHTYLHHFLQCVTIALPQRGLVFHKGLENFVLLTRTQNLSLHQSTVTYESIARVLKAPLMSIFPQTIRFLFRSVLSRDFFQRWIIRDQ